MEDWELSSCRCCRDSLEPDWWCSCSANLNHSSCSDSVWISPRQSTPSWSSLSLVLLEFRRWAVVNRVKIYTVWLYFQVVLTLSMRSQSKSFEFMCTGCHSISWRNEQISWKSSFEGNTKTVPRKCNPPVLVESCSQWKPAESSRRDSWWAVAQSSLSEVIYKNYKNFKNVTFKSILTVYFSNPYESKSVRLLRDKLADGLVWNWLKMKIACSVSKLFSTHLHQFVNAPNQPSEKATVQCFTQGVFHFISLSDKLNCSKLQSSLHINSLTELADSSAIKTSFWFFTIFWVSSFWKSANSNWKAVQMSMISAEMMKIA